MVNAKGALEQDFCALLWASVCNQAVWEKSQAAIFVLSWPNPNKGSDDLNRIAKPHKPLSCLRLAHAGAAETAPIPQLRKNEVAAGIFRAR